MVRGTDGGLRLVNSAYVSAVGGENAESVVAAGTELIEPTDGLSARQIALQAASQKMAIERIAAITINGTRRAFRVSDLPLGKEGIADMPSISRIMRI